MNELSPLQAYQALLENHPERAQPVINFELQKAILAEIRDLPRMWNHRGYPYQEENHLRVAVGVHAQTGKLITPAQVGWTYRSCKDALESRLELSILRKKHDSTQTEQYLEDWYLYPYVSFFRSTLMDQETRFRAKAAENAVKPQWMINYEMAQEAAEKFRNAKENCGENAALQRNSNQHQVQQGPPSDDVREVLQERQYQAPPPNQKPSNPPPVYHLVQPRFERSGADSSKRPSQGGLKWEIAEDVSKQIQVPKRRRHDLVSSQLDNQQCEALPPAQRPHRPSPMEHHSSERSGHKGIKREVTDKFPELFPTPERRSQDQDSSHIRINHDPTRSGRSRAPLPPQCPPFPRPGQSRIKIETLEEHPELFQTPERTLQEQDYSQLEALLNQKPRNMTLHQASPPHICHRRPSPLPVEHRPQEPFNCFATYSSDNQRDHYLTPPHDFPRPDSHLTYVRRSTSSQCLALQSNFLHEEDYNGYNNSASSSMHHGSSRGTPGMQTAVRQAQRQDQQRNVADDKEMLRGAFEMALEQTRTLPAHKFEQLMDVMMKTIELYRSM